MAEVCCGDKAAECTGWILSIQLSVEIILSVFALVSQKELWILMASHEKSLLYFWKVISQHKYSESFPQISYFLQCLLSFHFHWSPLLWSAQSWETAWEAEKASVPKFFVCPLSFLEPRLSLVICRKKFLAHRVTSTSTRMTCSTSRTNTGKVMEQSHCKFNPICDENLDLQMWQICFVSGAWKFVTPWSNMFLFSTVLCGNTCVHNLSTVLRSKEKIETPCYQFKTKRGSYVLLQSQWFSFTNPWTKEVEFIVSLNRVISWVLICLFTTSLRHSCSFHNSVVSVGVSRYTLSY